MPTAEQLRTRLIKKLKELFQLDQPDLDFGFYRIMHAKAAQVSEFIEKDLLQTVENAFGESDGAKQAALKGEYEKAVETARSYGAPDPENTPQVKDAKARYIAALQDASGQADIYDHLYRFFERYYDEGDFISRRYYARETEGRAAPFAIPYSGEEVKLHWANSDQYYIKTAEYFSNFTFDLSQAATAQIEKNRKERATGSGDLFSEAEGIPDGLKVQFRIVEATEGEHGNVKASDTTKRFFISHKEKPVEMNETGELIINFEYRPDPEKSGQEGKWREKKNEEAVSLILSTLNTMAKDNGAIAGYLRLLTVSSPTENDKKRVLLARYINQYTARNTMDYFIHKDLGAFLHRELDFYIKNEVMRLDDIESADVPAVESYLTKIKILRQIAGKLIDFLVQLENFQKKLWLKKKFVVETNYCITLDRVPEELYPEIAANDDQREEWVRLFAVDEIKGDLVCPGYSTPLTTAFLKANDKLVLDTRFFDEAFKDRLLSSIQDFDEQCDGLLIHSENFQALNLLKQRYRETVKCVYIDPPYNIGGDGFAYKDSYQHASWMTMISERLSASYPLFSGEGVLFCSIDATERNRLEHVLNFVFQPSNRVEEIIWVQNTTHNDSPTYSTNHEYVPVYARDKAVVEDSHRMFREPKPGFSEISALVDGLNTKYPTVKEIQEQIKQLMDSHRQEFKAELEKQGLIYNEDTKKLDPWKGIYNYRNAEYRNDAGKLVSDNVAAQLKARIWVWREIDPSMPSGKQSDTTREHGHPNFRFYAPMHPATGKLCSVPKRGWVWPLKPLDGRMSFEQLDADQRIAYGADETKIPQLKRFLHEGETNVAKSVIHDYTDGEKELTNLEGRVGAFPSLKPSTLIKLFASQTVYRGEVMLDYFAGSGTTGHAIVNLNREDAGKRKYILVEMGDYFDTILKPRVIKVAYASDWKDGKPSSRATGISNCIKYLRLESYEDALNNLRFDDNPLRTKAVSANQGLKEDYMLHYLLDVETKGSQSLLNIDAFSDPTAYTLEVKKPGSDEYMTKAVDLLETFNYLIGLRVTHTAAPQTFAAAFTRLHDPELPDEQHTKLVLDGKLKQDAAGPWWFRKVEGSVPADPSIPNNGSKEKVLIVWRKFTGNLEEDNLVLDEWFEKNRISTRDFEFDTIYVNGSNNLPNLLKEGDHWKVRLIEEEFMKRMWGTDQ